MFVDRVTIQVAAGDGGNGIVAFRREKYVPLGGPAGGDGGDGGNIIFEVDTNKSTLLDLRYSKHLKAEAGGKGLTKKMHGANGKDVVVKVPLGTLIKDVDTNELLADLKKVGQRAIIARGGKGGRGNWHFASPKNSAPDYAELGQAGQKRTIQVELKLLADAGLIGFPSVGKSTFLSVVTQAKPEIAAYPFTTIQPNLGVVETKDGSSFVLADLPGLIEGAAQGKGLGHLFLRHIERCRVLIHVIDMGSEEGRDPIEDYRIINQELEAYTYRLLERPQVLVANKMDLPEAQGNLKRFQEAYPDLTIYPVSTLSHEGLEPVLYQVKELLLVTPEFPLMETQADTQEDKVIYEFKPKPLDYSIRKLNDHEYEVVSERASRLMQTIDFETEEGIYRFANILREIGIDDGLREAGCKEGDTVLLDRHSFEFVE